MITIIQESPDSPDARLLIETLEAYLEPLYPAESRHGLSITQLTQEGVAFFVVRVDGTAAGCAGLKLFSTPEPYGEVKRMYVQPQFQGQGLAKKLLNHLANVARSRGTNLLRLEAGIYQLEALNLYKAMEFYDVPPFGSYQEDSLSVFYEKHLS